MNWEDEDSLYLLGDKLFEDFEIHLGSFEVPRFSCACHKLNIVIQSAIVNQKDLQEVIKTLSSLASKIRSSIIFNQLKCRPKIENKTRWFSQLYVLLWAQSAYRKGSFNGVECSVLLEAIESYIQILLPAYKFNLSLQSLSSSICDVVPGVLRLKYLWERMVLSEEKQEMVYFLLHFLLKKFKHELESPIYHVNRFK